MRGVCQHTERDVFEAFPILQEIWQDVITDFVDILAMHMTDNAKMWSVNDDFATEGNSRFEFVNRFGGRPQLVVHCGSAGQHTLIRFLAPADVTLGR